MPYLTIAGMLALTLFPALVPAIITLVHALTAPATDRAAG
ncbi:putative membrane protein [Mycobacterium kansasii 732]|uniref:Uncharacterized protein n=1 Tax=Mycobacterium pseudokansasii TaxID=2341080 RepID=A0A498QMV5_9MYCO|nr:putative membrane protein [Mycobacterium kansasii 732]VAZ91098.1 hypothetical protein LAUMK35_01497 [Mycobacterium pseudokansasii]VAZ92000.1 hypothetical protein LAUMK21_01496 [Mycobacterium pseudokansasii]VBA48462.1 hypothetical protein LAUMK142_01359 [Mycobacterium pseudokansasii]